MSTRIDKGKDTATKHTVAIERPTPEAYGEFIRGIELRDVRLISAKIRSAASRFEASNIDLRVTYNSKIEQLEAGKSYVFEAYPQLVVRALRAGSEDEELGFIDVSYGLRYDSELEPTAGFLHIFRKVNLRVNAWPYLREYVQQTTTRFGWTPLVLPTLKTAPAKPKAGSEE